MAAAPFDLDVSLRALASGWFTTDRTIPVTIIDIDEQTHAAWGRPAMTPRDAVARLIATATAAGPAAVVVDIDLSWGGVSSATDPGDAVLQRLLAHHSGPSLIFPKRLIDSGATAHPAPSDYDTLIGRQPALEWGYANFATGGGGAVRNWHQWVDVCDGGVLRPLPAVAALATPAARPRRVPGLGVRDCAAPPDTGPTRRLLLGPRMTGPERVPTAGVQAISASLVLDSMVARDDSALFHRRIVLIGATHADAGDLWLTPRGIVPGVELLASTIHYARLLPDDGLAATIGYRVAVVILFLGLAAITWHMVGIPMIVSLIATLIIATALAVGLLEWFRFFDALAAALVLFVAYEAGRAVIETGWDFRKAVRTADGPRRRRVWTALKAVSLREQTPKGDAE